MLASQTILSNLHIPAIGLQPEVNDAAGAVFAARAAQKAGQYKSPGNLSLPQWIDDAGNPMDMQKLVDDPRSAFNSVVVNHVMAAVREYESLITGPFRNLAKIHAAVDAINCLIPVSKPLSGPIQPRPDLVLLSEALGIVGITAQQLRNGEILSFDTDDVIDAIIDAAKAGKGPASMQPTDFS